MCLSICTSQATSTQAHVVAADKTNQYFELITAWLGLRLPDWFLIITLQLQTMMIQKSKTSNRKFLGKKTTELKNISHKCSDIQYLLTHLVLNFLLKIPSTLLYTYALVCLYTCIFVDSYTCTVAYLSTCIFVHQYTCIPIYPYTFIPVYLYTCILV